MHTTAVYTYDIQTLDERKAWFDMKNKANEPIFVFEQAGKAVGFATYGQFRNWPAYLYSIEHSIYVDKSNRAKALLLNYYNILLKMPELEIIVLL